MLCVQITLSITCGIIVRIVSSAAPAAVRESSRLQASLPVLLQLKRPMWQKMKLLFSNLSAHQRFCSFLREKNSNKTKQKHLNNVVLLHFTSSGGLRVGIWQRNSPPPPVLSRVSRVNNVWPEFMMNMECQTVERPAAEPWNVSTGDKVDEVRWVGLAGPVLYRCGVFVNKCHLGFFSIGWWRLIYSVQNFRQRRHHPRFSCSHPLVCLPAHERNTSWPESQLLKVHSIMLNFPCTFSTYMGLHCCNAIHTQLAPFSWNFSILYFQSWSSHPAKPVVQSKYSNYILEQWEITWILQLFDISCLEATAPAE